MGGADNSEQLQLQLLNAIEQKQTVSINGGGSKSFYGRAPAETDVGLDICSHNGIISYQPTELVITARAGTSISEISRILEESDQILPFEPPTFAGKATLGGSLACGLSGPARPYAGAARDFVLGTNILNGKGELLRFGGEVIKNVAGYDVSRLMVGAMGTLGVILQASLKVLPKPEKETTLSFHLERDSALEMMNTLAGRSLPVSATCFYRDILYLRLSGSDEAVESTYLELGGDRLPKSEHIWNSLREFQHPFFDTDLPLWRLGLPAGATPNLPGDVLIEWGGCQWWLQSEAPGSKIRKAVSDSGGHASLFRGGDRQGDIFHPLPANLAALQQRIKIAFDPYGVLNPGRLVPTS